MDSPTSSAEPGDVYPEKITPIPPPLFTVSINATFANLSFETTVELKKALDALLAEVEITLFKPDWTRVKFQPRHLSSTISDQNGF